MLTLLALVVSFASFALTPIKAVSTTLCAGSAMYIDDSLSPGGTWTSSNTAVATVTGYPPYAANLTGVSAGIVTITYTLGTYVTQTFTINPLPAAITGATTIAVGATSTFADATPGGTWSTSASTVASIGATTGVQTGVSAGACLVYYTVAGCKATIADTVNTLSGICGNVLFTGAPYTGSVKVYLIRFNPTTLILSAYDSTTVTGTGASAYYQFSGIPTDSFRVKAAVTSGYIPTYYTSNFYWYGATSIYHTSGTADLNKDITMVAGTPTSGPGFIGGSVTTGANKGTSSAPAVGLQIYVLNSTGAVMQQTQTDASGNYSFSTLPVGTYTIFPEALAYMTTPITSITLTTGAPSMNTANFIQHTKSYTITPGYALDVNNISSSVSPVFVFPNPSNGKLNIQTNAITTENGSVTISDITGRQVFTTTININQGAGINQVDLSGLNNGLYLLNIKSASINYNSKIQVTK